MLVTFVLPEKFVRTSDSSCAVDFGTSSSACMQQAAFSSTKDSFFLIKKKRRGGTAGTWSIVSLILSGEVGSKHPTRRLSGPSVVALTTPHVRLKGKVEQNSLKTFQRVLNRNRADGIIFQRIELIHCL